MEIFDLVAMPALSHLASRMEEEMCQVNTIIVHFMLFKFSKSEDCRFKSILLCIKNILIYILCRIHILFNMFLIILAELYFCDFWLVLR